MTDNIKILRCSIAHREPSVFGNDENILYIVKDGARTIASGISSSESWVRNDAGGYHTKDKFDELYPNGWTVTFDF